MNLPSPHVRPIVLLVDGENLGKDRAADVLKAARRFGDPQVRRVYGNLNAISGWEDHGFRLCPTRPGKNAADMLLCVEAMVLALRDGFETLVIASSDGDFGYLAEMLRESGRHIIGAGEAKTPHSFRSACTEFMVLPAKVEVALPKLKTPSARGTVPPPVKRPATKIIPLVRRVLGQSSNAEGWATVGLIGHALRQQDSSFKVSDYGEKSLQKLLLGLNYFQTSLTPGGMVQIRDLHPATTSPVQHSVPGTP